MSVTEHPSYTQIQLPTPTQEVRIDELIAKPGRLFFKRDDLSHTQVSGNKWRKLKYNIDYILQQKLKGLVTFGGAFSNHIYATAAAGHMFGIAVVIYVRGEINDIDNPTLSYCRASGATLISMTREDYREKNSPEVLASIQAEYPDHWIIPEGGSNTLARDGVREMMSEVYTDPRNYDLISVGAGTGSTAAGVITAAGEAQVHVYSSLKGDFLQSDISSKLKLSHNNWLLNTDYHQGGYAKVNKAYIQWINEWYRITKVPLDPIYTGKMVYGIIDLMRRGLLDHEINHLVIHTGGLQGITAYNYLHARKYGMIDVG